MLLKWSVPYLWADTEWSSWNEHSALQPAARLSTIWCYSNCWGFPRIAGRSSSWGCRYSGWFQCRPPPATCGLSASSLQLRLSTSWHSCPKCTLGRLSPPVLPGLCWRSNFLPFLPAPSPSLWPLYFPYSLRW